jgi:hypothetical protein
VVERLKNVIIRDGQNFFASPLESQVARLLHVSPDQVAVFEADIGGAAREVICLVEMRASEAERLDGVLETAMRRTEVPIDRLLVARRGTIPRTTSGKKRHFSCRQLVAAGTLAALRDVRRHRPEVPTS